MHAKGIRRVGLMAFGAAIAFGSVAANAVTVNTLTFQGVTFTTTSIDADSMTLRIQNALTGGTGNWAPITDLWTLGIDPVGTVTSATITPFGTFSGKELNANGCAGGLSGKACFTFSPFLDLTDDMLFTVDFVGTGLNMDAVFHVKVGFLCSPTTDVPDKDTKACGDLLSKDIFTASSSGGTSSGNTSNGNQVPEPSSSLVLLGLGALGMGFVRRRKKAA